MATSMNSQTLEIYEIFKKALSETEAQKIVTYIEDSKDKEITSTVERKIEHLATKEEMAKQFGEAKADNIKWMFIFWIGQVAAIVGILFAFFKK